MLTEILTTLSTYQLYGWIALLVAAVMTPVAMVAARKLDVMDHPDQVLKPHSRPTPYLGGAAILVGWTVAIWAAWLSGRVEPGVLLPLWGGGLAVGVMGLYDDAQEMSAKWRLLIEAVAILAVMLITGVGFELADAFTNVLGFTLPSVLSVPISLGLALFIVLGAINATNLIDGLDGLCAGVTTLIGIGFAILAAFLMTQEFSPANDAVRLTLSLALSGATLGFLIFNFNPARIFMGDGGSILLGYVSGMLIVLFAENASLRWLVAALIIFTLPVFDAALAIFRRFRSGKPLFEGDRSHFYDQLRQRGCSIKQTALICYGATAVFASVGLTLIVPRGEDYLISDGLVIPLALAFVVLVAAASVVTGFTNPEQKPPASANSESSTTTSAPTQTDREPA